MPLARLHRDALVARGFYTWPAAATSAYHVARLLLVLGLIAAGWSIAGVITANLGARALELGVYRRRQTIPVRGSAPGGLSSARNFLGSLLVYALCLQLFNRVDLLMLGLLDAPPDSIGHFSAAQNLALAPGLFAMVFTPMLIASLGRAEKNGNKTEVMRLRSGSTRLAWGLWALAIPVAAGSDRLVTLLFGAGFAPSGPLLALLAVAGGSLVVLSVWSAQEVARGRHRRPLAAVLPMLGVALALHWVLIPRFGALGAAWSTAASACLAAVVAQALGAPGLKRKLIEIIIAGTAGATGLFGTRLAALAGAPSPLDIVLGCLVTTGALMILGLSSREESRQILLDIMGMGGRPGGQP